MQDLEDNHHSILKNLNLIEGTPLYSLGLDLLNASRLYYFGLALLTASSHDTGENTSWNTILIEFSKLSNTKIEYAGTFFDVFINLAGYIDSPIQLLTAIKDRLPSDNYLVHSLIDPIMEFYKKIKAPKGALECLAILNESSNFFNRSNAYFSLRGRRLNFRNEEGNTLFYILFDTLMKENPIYFNELLRLIMSRVELNLQLKNLKGETIYCLPYLSEDQKELMSIAEIIGLAKKDIKILHENLDPAHITQYKYALILKVGLLIIQLKTNDNFDIYFEVLKLYLDCKKHCFENADKYINFPGWKQHLMTVGLNMENRKGLKLWKALNEVLLFPDNGCNAFKTIRILILEEILTTLTLEPEIFNLTQEQLKNDGIEHPYKIIEDDEEMLNLLLNHEMPFDVMIDDKENESLLLSMLRKNYDLRLVLKKLYLCPKTINLPDARGNTPLYYAIKSGEDIVGVALLRALKEQGHDIDARDKNNVTPFYLALNSLVKDFQNITIVFEMLNNHQISVAYECTLDNRPVTALDLWINLIKSKSGIFSSFILKVDEVRKILHLGILLWQHGACFPTENQMLEVKQVLRDFRETANHVLQDNTDDDPFLALKDVLLNISEAWGLIKQIENREPISRNKLSCFMFNYLKTHRNSDRKTKWEIVSQSQLMAKNELEMLAKDVQDNEKIESCQQHISICEQVLSLLILYNANPEQVNDVYHKQLVVLVKKFENMLSYRALILNLEKQPVTEEQMYDLGREILENINNEMENRYPMFLALYCYGIAKCLFCVKEEKNRNQLLISNRTINLNIEFIKRAEFLSRSLTMQDTELAENIIQLHTKIISFSNSDDFEKIEAMLRAVIQSEDENVFKVRCPKAYTEMYNTFRLLADSRTDKFNDLPALIPAALRNSKEKLAALTKEVGELEAAIQQAEAERSSCVRKANAQEIEDSNMPPEKRKKITHE